MSDPYYGEIKMIGFYYPPLNYAFCNGQTMTIQEHAALYSLLGVKYGGDGKVSFNLPDLRGRVPIHSANGEPGPNLSKYMPGEKGGLEYANLTVDQIPVHSHTATVDGGSVKVHCSGDQGDTNVAEGNFWAQGGPDGKGYKVYNEAADTRMNANAVTIDGLSVEIGDTGGTKPYLRLQPYLAINFIIALKGTYPPRN
ncbi:phage tail protein [Desulfobacter sp.]|uniref:phage tail protein n=1 Tax=Desulfobacter sp. TaxID=2294 RepID=UPI003D0C9F7B